VNVGKEFTVRSQAVRRPFAEAAVRSTARWPEPPELRLRYRSGFAYVHALEAGEGDLWQEATAMTEPTVRATARSSGSQAVDCVLKAAPFVSTRPKDRPSRSGGAFVRPTNAEPTRCD
jgi:hypothetical protein